jgi:transposase
MWYVGLDVHWTVSVISVLDDNGKEQFCRTVRGTWDMLLEELEKIKRPFKICFEASTGYGTIYDKLKTVAREVTVAHPGHLRLIFRSKRKTDRIDARKLAKLLYFGEIPAVYVPSLDVRAWRAMIEHRNNLVKESTRAKNSIRTTLRGRGIRMPKGLWTQSGLKWLETLELPTAMDAIRRDDLLERLSMNTRMVKRVEKELKKIADAHPGVQLLMSIRGVGMRTAEALVAYIDNPQRFGKNRSIGNYFGLIPCHDESAGKQRIGHITQQGPSTVRKLLVQAAWQAVRREPTVKKRYERIMRGSDKRKKIAITAIAHYLARVSLAMLKHNREWNPGKIA